MQSPMFLRTATRYSGRFVQRPFILNQARFNGTTFASRPMMSALSNAIIRDHSELNEYYERIVGTDDLDTQTRYQNLFTWELARHSIGEELVVYPAFEKHLGAKGKQMADKDREDHQKVKNMLYKFQSMKAEDPEFLKTLQELFKDLKEHIQDEERNDLPALERQLDEDSSDAYARSFERTKLFVPTRSHPSAPDKPPFETVAGLMAAPLDKLMDLFRKFPNQK
ncbi:uncharacterized protein DFL_009251 [Arthrobotrys flagrans]|uniref:Hemerythrin-like domain-containing protein n=1 Tax=Arthrobotrys flagrans TaxID=97331 RepID=A0A436ZR92_ARTFL|nr:hypothetical protein DFL_009251 [Arthrobotrys flagrans]